LLVSKPCSVASFGANTAEKDAKTDTPNTVKPSLLLLMRLLPQQRQQQQRWGAGSGYSC